MIVERPRIWVLWVAVAAVAGCSTPAASSKAPPSQETVEKTQPKIDPKIDPKAAALSGAPACAVDPAPFWEAKVEESDALVNPTVAPLRLELPDAIKGVEPPVNAGALVGPDSSAIYSSATQSLLGRGRPFAMDCQARAAGSDFIIGCMYARGCALSVPTPNGTTRVTTMAELAKAIGSVDTASEAIGLAALYDRNVWLPYGSDADETIARTNDFFKWLPTQKEPVKITADEHPWGWVLRLPAYHACGCQHHMFRVAYRVTRDGQVCRLAEEPKLIGYAQTSVCID